VNDWSLWFFQWAFSATAATIVSGAVAERITFEAYVIYTIALCSFIYPFVVHWCWAGGWLSPWKSNNADELIAGCGTLDFAGSGVVHMVGGVAALVAIAMVGPREGAFSEGGIKTPVYAPIFQSLGTVMLWVGWYGFNGVSTLAITGLSNVAAKAMVTTTIAAASGCISCLFAGYVMTGSLYFPLVNNGVLAGLVAITSGCATVELEGALVIGFVAAWLYYFTARALRHFQLDDVVDAVPIHGVCGCWGVIAAGLFTTEEGYANAYYEKYNDGGHRAAHCQGAFYGGHGHQLAANLCQVAVIIGWVVITVFVVFKITDMTVGLRVTPSHEEIGLDSVHHELKPYHDNSKSSSKSNEQKEKVKPESQKAAVEMSVGSHNDANV
jgi:Amt family ammonium transporter